jgi:hypothetical protein
MSTTFPLPHTTLSWPFTRMIFARAGQSFIQPRPVTLVGEPIQWVDTTRYLGVTLGKRLTWSPYIGQVSGRTAQRMGLLGPLLNRRSKLSVRNGVLLYKQLIRPLMDYTCPVWRSAARIHVRRLQVLQSKCLRFVTGAPQKQADSRGSGCSAIRRPHQSPDYELLLKVNWHGEPLSSAIWHILTLCEGWPLRPTRKPRAAGPAGRSRSSLNDGQVDQTIGAGQW